MSKCTILFLLVWINVTAFAQKPKAKFLSDSVQVGSPVKLAVTYLHDSRTDLSFPDSSYDFSPFSYVSTEFFETETEGNKSKDSVIYTLVTYKLDSVLSISPFLTKIKSGEKVFTDTAKVYLKSLIDSDSLAGLKVKKTIELFNIKKEFNVPLLLYYLFGVLFSGLIVFSLFRGWFIKRYRLFKFDRQHKKFLSDFKKQGLEPRNVENIKLALNRWKSQMEFLDRQPISTMSTSEIFELYNDERLEAALKMFDAAIFGGMIEDRLPFGYHILQDFEIRNYKKERSFIK